MKFLVREGSPNLDRRRQGQGETDGREGGLGQAAVELTGCICSVSQFGEPSLTKNNISIPILI